MAILATGLLLSLRRATHDELMPVAVTHELKGLAILAIVFAHISFMLVTDFRFLYPLALGAGVGVDLFLFISGFGLTVGMLKKPLAVLPFYRRRLLRLFIPLWVVLTALFAADAAFLGRSYSAAYVLQSFLGIYPSAIPTDDVNSPFWYVSWILLFYALFPLLFMARRPWLTAMLLAMIANLVAIVNPLHWQASWLHQLHTNAFSIGMLFAWVLQVRDDSSGRVAAVLRRLRAGERLPPTARYVLLAALAAGAAYLAAYNEEWHWPRLAEFLRVAGFSEHFFIGQATSLLATAAAVLFFTLKRLECRLLRVFGVYSYETYLMHWPLMARYDLFFRYLPAWLAVIVWLAAFLAIGGLLQRITTPVNRWLDAPVR